MKRYAAISGASALGLAMSIASAAAAQTWQATTQLAPNAPSSCANATLPYEFTLANGALSVKVPTGQTHRGSVAADGTVAIHYKSAVSGGGDVTISGNVGSRVLRIASSQYKDCVYVLMTAVESIASAYQGTVG